MNIAIVTDWLTVRGGAEACVGELLSLYPQADLFSLIDVLPEADRAFLHGRAVRTSFLQRMPGIRKRHRAYLPLMPLAVEQFDLSVYDLIISTSSAVAKGVITGPNQVHIAYTFTPMRYAWDLQNTYLKEARLTTGLKSAAARVLLHYMRLWDVRTQSGVDEYVAISHFIARRIRKAYGRSSTVIYPPVDLTRFALNVSPRDEFYLTMSRMVPYKRIPLIVEAFAHMPDRHLVVIGDGPDIAEVKRLAGPNVSVMGKQSDDVVVDYMQRAKAFLFAAEEDFGIAPVEAQACGTPVIAFAKGGATETIRGHEGEDQTGVFFGEQSIEAICAAVEALEDRPAAISPHACRANAERFSTERFRRAIDAFVADTMEGFLTNTKMADAGYPRSGYTAQD